MRNGTPVKMAYLRTFNKNVALYSAALETLDVEGKV